LSPRSLEQRESEKAEKILKILNTAQGLRDYLKCLKHQEKKRRLKAERTDSDITAERQEFDGSEVSIGESEDTTACKDLTIEN
jgi:hypothetical protein